MYEIAKMCEINEFKISKFQNFAKGSDVDPFNIPEEQESETAPSTSVRRSWKSNSVHQWHQLAKTFYLGVMH